MKKMSRNLKLLVGAVVLLGVLLGVVLLVTLSSPTQTPSQKSLDYLKVFRSLSAIQSRVEVQKSNAANTTPLPDLNEAERLQIVQQSDGLIRQVELRPDGAIDVQAVIASNRQGDSAQSVSVHILLVLEKVGEKYDWHCFGEPVSALPKFCGKSP